MPDAPATATDAPALLRLAAGGLRAGLQRRLLDSHGSAAAALAAGPRDWASHGIPAEAVRELRNPDPDALRRGERWLADPGHHVLGWRDPDYPPLLRRIASPPALLFVAGDPVLLWRPALAIVGSRAATAGGCANATSFARAMAATGLCVASGLAAGIDGAAHQAALEAGGATVAVLGTGPDVAYPVRHRPLLERIAAEGAVASEHLPGTGPLRQHFPSRNRILAGLSLGVLVVEAAERSGALVTARLAAEAGREVFALPGSIHNPMARGCHRLLREGAALVESPAEVLEALAPLAADLARTLRGSLGPVAAGVAHGPPTHAPPPDGDHHRLWEALGHDPTGMDELVERSGLTAANVSSILLAWELDGRVTSEHGRYTRTGA